MNNKKSNFAGFSTRLLAHNIDLIPILLLLYLVSYFVPSNSYDLVLFGGIYLAYYIGFEASSWQATPGKKWVKIRIVGNNGEKVTISKVAIRSVLKFVSLIIFFGGFIMIIFNKKKQSFHDFIVGTVVLFNED